jgi:hypothetical protein
MTSSVECTIMQETQVMFSNFFNLLFYILFYNYYSLTDALQPTMRLAILWRKEAQWAAVHWWAFVRAETASLNISCFFHLFIINLASVTG